MTNFKQSLAKVAKLTPEAFYRVCDYNYAREVSTGDFKNKIKELELGLGEKCLHRLVSVLDEDFNGSISLEEYYFALDTYNCRSEEYGPLDNDSNFVSF